MANRFARSQAQSIPPTPVLANYMPKENLSMVPRCSIYAFALGMVVTFVSFAVSQQVAKQTPQPSYRILHKFRAGADGARPEAGLIRDAAGNLYGTTFYGNTVFKINKAGKKTVLHAFGAEGVNPNAALVMDSAGNLYGTATGGGFSPGTVFKVDKTGQATILYNFTGGLDGGSPTGRLVRDHAGNLYGTTAAGGDPNCNGGKGCGVVFKLDTIGGLTPLHQFAGTPDGAFPLAGLVRDASGNLYGTTSAGGDAACLCGTVFELDTSSKETVLHSFTGSAVGGDGGQPLADLLRDAKGNLYGTTSSGGAHNDGTVFKLDAAGEETVLYSFAGGTNGANPHAGLVRDAAGTLYGTTYGGGGCGSQNQGCGIVFKLDTTGKETILHLFAGGTDGELPTADLIRDASGTFYGTTDFGGDLGTVFSIHP